MPSQDLANLSAEQCKNIQGIFCDIDDTISWQGKIPAAAYNALWNAKEAGLKVIPITGRPAGWVDHLVRMWPVDAVIGENGAFYFHLDLDKGRDGLLKRRFLQEADTRLENKNKLFQIFDELKQMHPKLQTASDQAYREIDIAIDFCEDVDRLSNSEIDQIVDKFIAAGAQAKISSVHVNAWFGSHDKFHCCKILLSELYGEDIQTTKKNYVYFGDSPNDEPLFKEFPTTIGVANVRDYLDRMSYPPTFITKEPGGHGFAQAVDYILSHR